MGRRSCKVEVFCQECGRPFDVQQCEVKRGGGKYCSIKCKNESPEYIAKMSEAQKKRFESQEARKKMSEAKKKAWENQEYREKMSEAQKKAQGTPDARKKMSEAAKKAQGTPDARKKMSEAAKKRYSNLQWYGNVRYYDGPQYCEKWTEDLRERNRAWFGYQCVECGSPQNGKKLHVHHVWYNKRLCCDDTPRTLVPLCPSCHAKTNTNREYWSNHFQEMIDTYYDGKCWFTKEEMALFKSQ